MMGAAMKPTVAIVAFLAIATAGAALAYQTAARERDYREQIRRGDGARRDDQGVAAIEAYSGAIVLRPDSMLPYLRRAETYATRGDLDAAARDFRTAAGLDPSAVRPLDELGDVLYERQRFDAAAESYEKGLRLDERSPGITYKLALARYRDGDIDAALKALDQTLRLTDRMSAAYYLRGLCLREKHEPADAAKAFERAVALSPGMIPAREELADLYGAAGRRADELEQLQLLAGLDRDHVERYVAMGLAHARSGQTDAALLTLTDALDRAPGNPAADGALGRVWLDMAPGRSDALNKALHALERAASTAAAPSETLAVYGRALLRANQPEEAEAVLLEALQRYPVDPAAYVAYADAAERENHLEAARNALRIHAALAPDDADSAGRALRIGTLSLKLNDPLSATQWLQRASQETTHDNRQLAAIADAQLRAGDRAGALDTIERGLGPDPGNAALLALAQRAQRRE